MARCQDAKKARGNRILQAMSNAEGRKSVRKIALRKKFSGVDQGYK